MEKTDQKQVYKMPSVVSATLVGRGPKSARCGAGDAVYYRTGRA